ncbi:MAG: nucleoside deaminase [Parachlamydiaceae bacterium]|nr:nucleoside deaminase [Parachlamydiaceae bacterium]
MKREKRPFPFVISATSDDEKFMLLALREAWTAFCCEEVPVGAVLVHKGIVIARGHNQVEMLKDATAHAEMLCMTAGEAALSNWRLADTVLYCTIEPCSMCAGAMLLTRIPQLVWGAPDLRHGANGSWIDLFKTQHPMHSIEVRSGVLQEYAAAMMRDFFQLRRQEKGKENDQKS